jgi:hypothetical protein
VRPETDSLPRRSSPADIRLGPGIPPTAHLRGPSVLTRTRQELGYQPRYTLEGGMLDWLRYLQGQPIAQQP